MSRNTAPAARFTRRTWGTHDNPLSSVTPKYFTCSVNTTETASPTPGLASTSSPTSFTVQRRGAVGSFAAAPGRTTIAAH